MKRRGERTRVVSRIIVVLLTATPVMAVDLGLNLVGGPLFSLGDTVTVTLDATNLSTLPAPINGIQVFLNYNTALLNLIDVAPNTGISVGWTEGMQSDVAGDVDWVATLNGGSTSTDHTVATLTFTAIGQGTTDFIFRATSSPVFTKLTDVNNNVFFPTLMNSGSITIDAAGPRVANVEAFYTGKFAEAADPGVRFLGAGSTSTPANVTPHLSGVTGVRVFFDRTVNFATSNPRDAFFFDWTTGNGTTFSPVAEGVTPISVTSANVAGVTVVTINLPDDLVRRRWLKITIDATRVSAGGIAMDGELAGNPVLLPSGDGIPGGDAVFVVGSGPGDVDGDRVTTLDDVIAMVLQVDLTTFVPITEVLDVDKDAVITLDDVIGTVLWVDLTFALPIIVP